MTIKKNFNLSDATINNSGLMTESQVIDLITLKNRYNGIEISDTSTITKPFIRLFRLALNEENNNSQIIFEIIGVGTSNTGSYAKIRVDIKQINNSQFLITPIEVYNFDLTNLYFACNNIYPNTLIDVFYYINNDNSDFIFKVYDDHAKNETITIYNPIPNDIESYTTLTEAGMILNNQIYDNVINNSSYNITANKFIKKNGTSTELLMADGSVKDINIFSPDIHTQSTSTIVNTEKYNNIKDGELVTVTLVNQKLINDTLDTKIGDLTNNITDIQSVVTKHENHVHGDIKNNGIIDSDIKAFNKIVVTNDDNEIKTITIEDFIANIQNYI